jgi:hypothetical protein
MMSISLSRACASDRPPSVVPRAEVAEAIVLAASRPRGVDCVTLRTEPMDQRIFSRSSWKRPGSDQLIVKESEQ